MKISTRVLPLLLLLSYLNVNADNISVKGSVDLTAQAYMQHPKSKHPQNVTARVNIESSYEQDALTLKTKVIAQGDYYDLESKEEHNERSYMRLDELFVQYDFEDDQLMFGKNIRFWGALEVRNITDNFNSNDLRGDVFEIDKLGAWSASYSHYTESGELSLIVKLYETSQKMAADPYVYYYLPRAVPTATGIKPLLYDSRLKSESGDMRPSIYLKYSGSTDSEYPIDYAIILENGYDSQRYFSTMLSSDTSSIDMRENAYLVNKILTYNTLVVGATLFKLEALYSDVIDTQEISDYYHIGLGVEHTLSQVYGDADLGLISEYYYYDRLDKSKMNDLELFEVFQNDLFVGLRYSFNQGNDASIVSGVIVDLAYDEQVYYLKYEGRLGESLKLNFDYRYIEPSKDTLTTFHLLSRHERLSFTLGYYF